MFPLSQPIAVHALSGLSLPTITHSTGPIKLIKSGNQRLQSEQWSSDILHINWGHNSVFSCSESCHESFLLSACSAVFCSVFLEECMVLSKMSCEHQAASLPPHLPYGCAIDLLPGTFAPKGKLYSLSFPKSQTMEKYIYDFLAAKIPSSSPMGAGFFFF